MSKSYRVEGMTCGGCVGAVTRAVERAVEGVKIEVSLEEKTLSIDGAHDAASVQAAVEKAGFTFGGAL